MSYNTTNRKVKRDINLTPTQWELFYSLIEDKTYSLEAQIKEEVNPEKKFNLKMELCEVDELLHSL
jgi:hypothetical protein